MGNVTEKLKINSSSQREERRRKYLTIQINELDVRIDDEEIKVDEKDKNVLKFVTPHFRATARVTIPPLDQNEFWKIGWIQGCTKMTFHNTYGDLGHSSWEFPELLNGERPMIGDSDGRNFPWYGFKKEIACAQGPIAKPSSYLVKMDDNFNPHVTWDIPLRYGEKCLLTRIKRDQVFFTWLTVMNVRTGELIVLKTFNWEANIDIEVNSTKSRGQRTKVVRNLKSGRIEPLDHNLTIPSCALYPSCANCAQTLVWRPASGPSQIVSGPTHYSIEKSRQSSLAYNTN